MTLTAIESRAATRHAEVLAGLENLHGFLTAHPALPLSSGGNPFDVHVYAGTDDENRAVIDGIARILGVAPVLNAGGTHYAAERNFGGGVFYEATAISRASMDRYRRHMAPYYGAEDAAAAAERAA